MESRILREEKKMWRRWKAWTLPSKIGVLSGIVTIALIPTVFVDVKPFVTHWLWPAKPHHIPNIAVQMKNSGKRDAAFSYRGTLFIWLPGEGAPHIPGTFEIVMENGIGVEPGMISIPSGSSIKVEGKVMNEANLYSYLARGDCEITLFFTRNDGSMFDSGELPFTEEAIHKYYGSTDIANESVP